MAARKKDPLFDFVAREMLEAHATHEWIAYLAYRAFHRRSPAAGAGHIMKEELEHYRLLEGIFPERWGRLSAAVKRRLARRKVPVIRSRLEFLVASWIFDFAGLVQIEGLRKSAWAPYRRIARAIVDEEREHKTEALERLAAFLKEQPRAKKRARRLADKWLALSALAFGNAGSPLDRLSVRMGLKDRTARAQRERFERAVRTAAARLLGDR